jgi:tRNA pseudouridine55 synthase
MKGFFAVYKPKGPTSHDIIDQLRLITKERKIGHAGTLDPLAQGVLVVAIGSEFTRKIDSYVKKDKEYLAVLELGKESVTDDEEGEKKTIKVIEKPSVDEVKKVLLEFKGKIKQIPPLYSAIKVSGKRAYSLARQNKKFSLKAREVEIKEIELIEYKYPKLVLRIETGPGTYIRSLARDIGKKLYTGAYLKNLERTRVGEFSLKDSLTINNFKKIK